LRCEIAYDESSGTRVDAALAVVHMIKWTLQSRWVKELVCVTSELVYASDRLEPDLRGHWQLQGMEVVAGFRETVWSTGGRETRQKIQYSRISPIYSFH